MFIICQPEVRRALDHWSNVKRLPPEEIEEQTYIIL